MPAARAKKPWPMRWIVLGMILFIIPYTYINLHYRKPGRSFLPYDDLHERERLGQAGYKRVTARLTRPADGGLVPADGEPVAGGLPEGLRASMHEPPLLAAAIAAVSAPGSAESLSNYQIRFVGGQDDYREQPADAHLYIKDHAIFVVPGYERLDGQLLSRTRESVLVITVPSGALDPGTYRMTLVGRNASRAWTLQVH